MGNSGLPDYIPILRDWAAADDDGLRDAAQWALNQIESNSTSGAESPNAEP